MSVTFHLGDTRDILPTLASGLVDCIVTSPPYFGLRSYDENCVRVDPSLSAEKREWLMAELRARNIHARS